MDRVKQVKMYDEEIELGIQILKNHSLFRWMKEWTACTMENKDLTHCVVVSKWGSISCNHLVRCTPNEWAYMIAHCILHLELKHFFPKVFNKKYVDFETWNVACDIYVTKFLDDIKFVQPFHLKDIHSFPIKIDDEVGIYEYLLEHPEIKNEWKYSFSNGCDMKDFTAKKYRYMSEDDCLEKYQWDFVQAIRNASKNAIAPDLDQIEEVKSWFISHYPLFGALASSFSVVTDRKICELYDIKVAAISMEENKIYINIGANLSNEEWKFVMAHEFLHVGLNHDIRQNNRDFFYWNVACDFVINGWLYEMQIGEMPNIGILYDETLQGMSAEEIYDLIISKKKRPKQYTTLGGLNCGDILHKRKSDHTISLDEFYRNALKQGLEYHLEHNRGYIPAGLIEEINTLAMPVIPWEVKLAAWLDQFITDTEKRRTYARLSRRQAATPDIIRPSYESIYSDKTFGVIIDTSGSMSTKDIGKALGSVVSYAVSKEVGAVRLVFCDAKAYDQGYVNPNEIAYKVEVTGRGGTRLQTAVDFLKKAKDFPGDAPILIITDGAIENHLRISREHAFLIPVGNKLPFSTSSKIFYYD